MNGMRITNGKGVQFSLENGIMFSIQIGRGNYCENYNFPHHDVTRENPLPGSTTAEIAIWSADDEMVDIQGDLVKGYVPVEDVLRFLEFIRSLPSDLVKSEIELAIQPFDWKEAV